MGKGGEWFSERGRRSVGGWVMVYLCSFHTHTLLVTLTYTHINTHTVYINLYVNRKLDKLKLLMKYL